VKAGAKKLSSAELALADDIGRFFHDPLGYVRYAFHWGHGELAGHDGPDAWQTEVLQALGRALREQKAAVRLAVASGHGVGKSALVAWLVLWAMSTRPDLAGVVTANTARQLADKTWRELALWHRRAINAGWFEWSASKFVSIDRPKTWAVSATPWSKEHPEAFAGLHAEHVMVLMDEASAIDDAIWEVTEGAMTTHGAMWLCFGNPTRNAGRFRQCFGAHRHRWITYQVDARRARMANQDQIAQWIEDYGLDSDFVRVRVLGEFPKVDDIAFIPEMLVRRAMAREPVATGADALLVGVDPAGEGRDESVIRFRLGNDAASIPPLRIRGRTDLMELAALVAEMARGESLHIGRRFPDGIFVDATGLGIGLVQRLEQLGVPVIAVQASAESGDKRFANKRTEMWGRMRDWLENAAALSPRDAKLLADLTAPQYGWSRRRGAEDRLQLEGKKQMQARGLASPDDGDALALTFAYPVVQRRAQLPGQKLTRRLRQYDPTEAW